MKLIPEDQHTSRIISFYGSFVRSQTYSLILEYADKGTLETFMDENYPPSNGQEIFSFWKQLFKLFQGLARIHGEEKTDQGPRILLG